MTRLRRSDLTAPGITRRRHGKGFHYRWANGTSVADPDSLSRIRDLAIPPAWKDVWICPWPNGHIQAIGVDNAGRRQYRYHDVWRAHRDREKFDNALRFSESLPLLRTSVKRDLGRLEMDKRRVLAAVLRLLDLGAFRIGGMEYADTNETYGLVSLQREHVRVSREGRLTFDYPAKCSIERIFEVHDPAVAAVVRGLKRRRDDEAQLFASKETGRWVPIRTDEVNGCLKERCGTVHSAKDFRNWTATVMAACLLAQVPTPTSAREERRLVKEVVTSVAEQLGNTPAVCRASYIDPRVIDRFAAGSTIDPDLAARVRMDRPTGSARNLVEVAVHDLIALDGDETKPLAA